MLLAPDAGGTGGGSSEAGSQAAGGNTQASQEGQQAGAKTFTQEELNAMFAERANQAKNKALTDVLEKTGYKSLDELNAAVEEGKKLKQSQMSEAEKTAVALKAAEDRATAAEKEKVDALEKANERLLKAAVIAQASSAGFRAESIEDVWLVIDRSKITEKDGAYQGLKEAVEAVAKAKPFWLSDQNKPKGTPGSGRQQQGNQQQGGQQQQALRPPLRL